MADVSEATVRKMETELTEDTYAIAKDVAKWIEKLFQAKINPKTIDSRARRMKALSSNEESQSTPQDEKGNRRKSRNQDIGAALTSSVGMVDARRPSPAPIEFSA